MAKYRIIPFEFDTILFSHVLREIEREDIADVAAVIGVSYSLLKAWINGRYDEEFPHPSMSNFIAVCNWLDLNPTIFFKIAPCEHEITKKYVWRDAEYHENVITFCATCGETVKYQIIERAPKRKVE